MDLRKWSRSNLEYGRKVLNSGLEGARSGREAFLHGESLTPFLSESVHNTWKPAAFGVCVGVLSGYPGTRNKSISRVLACGLAGGAVGFCVGIAWKSRRLTESVADGALRSISKVRDEHWLESHPIDYA
jgi:hypothetical protein